MYQIEIRTSDLSISNFNACLISLSVYQLANSAVFYVYHKDFEDLKAIKQALKVGDEVTVLVEGKLVLSGFVAAVDGSYFKHEPRLCIKINTMASVLVDASVSGMYFTATTVEEIIKRLVQPFQITFKNLSSKTVVLPYFAVSSTDKADEVLQKLAELSDTLIYSDESGALVMADRNEGRFADSILATTDNIINISKRTNTYKRFDAVRLFGQNPVDDNKTIDEIVSFDLMQKEKEGREVERCFAGCAEVCVPEKLNAKRTALINETLDLEVTGSSFFDVNGKLYQLNSLLRVKDEWLDVNDCFRIAEILFADDEKSTAVTLKMEVNNA